jgi:hypothetical protein
MITTGYNLPLALKVCKRLQTQWDETSCKSGVFMENVVSSYGGQSPWVRDEDPLYPCDWVAQSDKFTCYQLAATRIFRVVGPDWEKGAETCTKADEGFVETCFGSFGQSASLAAKRDPKEIRKICAIARPFGGEAACTRYAAMDITGAFLSGRRAAVLCTTTLVALRGTCFDAIGHILGTLKSTAREQRVACASTAPTAADLRQCVRGAADKRPPPGLARSAGR